MKKSIIISAALSLVAINAAAQHKANITLTNGETESYNVNELDRIDISADGKLTVVRSADTPVEYTSNIARLSFIKNRGGHVSILEAGGWFESAYVKWTNMAEADSYNVYYRTESSADYTKLDRELVRNYGEYGRADIPGIVAGNYFMKVVPVVGGKEVADMASETPALDVRAHDRSGFAHFNYSNGIGAYNNDGSLKAGAKVIYVTAENAATITTDVVTSNKGTVTTGVGLQDIITLYQKGQDTTPIDFRIIGRITKDDLDRIDSSAEGLQIKGRGSYSELNITIEGIGDDATLHGFGILMRNASSVEIRNLGFMWFMDDGMSLDTDNSHLWIHNNDIFYGQKGGASDQAKGDGSLDLKGDSQYITISYNRFWDSGKCSLCGMKSESGPNWITYHHNWFDHSDSRHPRIRTMSVHVYNNYFDGVAKYGVGATTGADVFVEANYFRDCAHPIMTSEQGTDIATDGTGTFSGENGGSIKSFANIMCGRYTYRPWSESNNVEFDAWEAPTRDAQMPSSITAKKGGDTYSNWDTNASKMYSYTADAAEDVPTIVKGVYGAGRCNHGDFRWRFNNNIQDINYEVITALSDAIKVYDSRLVDLYDGNKIGNGGVGSVNPGGDDTEGDEFPFGNYNTVDGKPTTPDNPDEPQDPEEPYIASADGTDYFRFNADSADQVNAWIADGTFTGGSFMPNFANADYWDGTGSYQLAKNGGEVVIKCPSIRQFKVQMLRTGSYAGTVSVSTDGGATYTEKASITGKKGVLEFDWSAALKTSSEVLVKITNTSTGGLNILGLYITK